MDEYNGEKYEKIPISTWGHKKLVTLTLIKTQVSNEDYLYSQVNDLWDATPPVTRKSFKPIAINENKSYGVALNSTTDEYHMIDAETTEIKIRFQDAPSTEGKDDTSYINNMIDTVKTTCVYDNDCITIPKHDVSVLDKNTRDYSPFTAYDSEGNPISNDMTCNEFWYVGYDKSRVYETRPNWVMNEEHGGIPAICRAQTFTVDLKDKQYRHGILETVVLNLHGECLQTGVPLIIEITEAVKYTNLYYPATRDQINNSRYGTTKYGDGRVAKQIAKAYWYPTNTDPGVVAITFDWGAEVEDGNTYAIVLRSPLNHQPNPYAVGGWNKHCDPEIYSKGDAFFSGNNGYTWIRYGKDQNVSYHEGKYAPQDFAFQCHIRQHYTERQTGTFYVYTKPLHFEKIREIILAVTDESNKGKIEYHAYNNITGEWVKFDDNKQIIFEKEEERPDVTIIRASLTLETADTAPRITAMTIEIKHDPFSKAMLRTLPYTPRTTGILAANTYSHVHCPYTVADLQNDKVTVDIVKETSNYAHLTLIPITVVKKYSSLCDKVTDAIKDEIQSIIDTGDETKKAELISNFFTVHGDVVEALKSDCGVYILEDPELGSFYLNGDSAYPIVRCSLQPDDPTTTDVQTTIDFTEWLDYTVNYDDDTGNNGNTLTFNSVAIKQLVRGNLTVEYNPLFAKNIPGTDYDDYSVKDIDLGFISESHTVLDDDIKTNVLGLITLTEALNPLREVKIIRDDADTTLVEGEDFWVDYDKKTIYIYTEKLLVGDIIQIKYTPYLVNESISICYHFNRSNTDAVKVQSNYIDYKT